MPETQFNRNTRRMDCLGLDLNRPVDSVKEGRFPYMKNCRSYQFGRIEPREGLIDLGLPIPGQLQVHSLRRLNDPLNHTWRRIIGTGTHLAVGTYDPNPWQDVDSGYSGEPLALAPFRPDQSPNAWMYIGDSKRMRKVRSDGHVDSIGYPPPILPPRVALADEPKYRTVDEFWPGPDQGPWAPGPSSPQNENSATNTQYLSQVADGMRTYGHIQYILYDETPARQTGWCNITLDIMTNPATGGASGTGNSAPAVAQHLVLSASAGGTSPTDELVFVQTVRPAAGVASLGQTPIAIASILYDHPGERACSVVLTAPVAEVDVDGLIHNVSTGDLARILAVISGPDGTTSIRLETLNPWATGQIVEILPTFRCYARNSHALGTIVGTDGVRYSTLTRELDNKPGTFAGNGWIDKTVDLDLSWIQPGLATQPEDLMAISVRLDHPEILTELKVQLDVDATTNDFSRNYYTRSFRPSDLTPSLNNLESTINNRQGVISNTVTTNPITIATDIAGANPPAPDTQSQLLQITTPSTSDTAVSQQMESGSSVWNALGFRISDLNRVGTDDTRTLANVKKLRILAMVQSTDPNNRTLVIDLTSWWIGGGYGPDTLDATTIPYQYRYRARNPATGVSSNPSPVSRTGMSPRRQAIHILPEFYWPPDPTTPEEVVIDIERFGGSIAAWHYVGSVANQGSFGVPMPPGLTDAMADDIAATLPDLGENMWQPWPVIDAAKSGSHGFAAGTLLEAAAPVFDVRWAPGTQIGVATGVFTIYRMVSDSMLEVSQNMGALGEVEWSIPEPTIQGVPLACLWGDEQLGAFFACGDLINPGRLYFSNGNNPDNTSEANWLDVTSPSEPLMNGVVYNLRSYVFSSERMFQILRTGNTTIPWTAQEIPNGKGLFARWAITREPAPLICFLSKDGVLSTTGGASTPLTDAELYPLLPNEGNPGVDTNGISAPDMTEPSLHLLRLHYYDEYLYFDYPGRGGGGMATLILASDLGATTRGSAPGGWFWDVYGIQCLFHYGEEGPGVHAMILGSADGHLYGYGGPDDAGRPYPMEFTTPSDDGGDPRSIKLYQDVMVDANTDGLDVRVTPYIDNNKEPAPAGTTVINTGHLRDERSIAVNRTAPLERNYSGGLARNLSVNFQCLISAGARPLFYIYESRWTNDSAPLASGVWEIAPTSSGLPNWKHFGMYHISYLSPVGVDVDIWTDPGGRRYTIHLPPHPDYKMEIFRVPVMKFKLWNVRISAAVEGESLRLDTKDSFIMIKEWGSNDAYRHFRVLDDFALIQG